MTCPLARGLAAEGFDVRLACGVLGFSTQAYYQWLAEPVSRRELEEAYLVNASSTPIVTIRRSATGSWPTNSPLQE